MTLDHEIEKAFVDGVLLKKLLGTFLGLLKTNTVWLNLQCYTMIFADYDTCFKQIEEAFMGT